MPIPMYRMLRRSGIAVALLCATVVQAQGVPFDLAFEPLPPAPADSATVGVRAPHDGSGRLFVVDQRGKIYVYKNGAYLPEPFLSVDTSGVGERGLLGLAFHPNYGKPGLPYNDEFYVYYTSQIDPFRGAIVVRHRASTNPDVANPNGTVVLYVPRLGGNHNGGDMHFGPDGYLYIAIGDGGTGAQSGLALCLWKKPVDGNRDACVESTSTTNYYLLGKILRIDVDHRGASPTVEMCGSAGIDPAQYSIPPTNPHAATAQTCDEIWAHGLRNPWRFSFDRADGRLIVGDVGENFSEEVTVEPPGSAGGYNYGWPLCEGRYAFRVNQTPDCPEVTGTLGPVIGRPRPPGEFAIIGGFVYRGPERRAHGYYFYADMSGVVRYANASASPTWDADGLQTALRLSGYLSSFGEDEAGNLYVVGLFGSMTRLLPTPPLFADGFDPVTPTPSPSAQSH